MRVALYARVSTEEQARNGLSIDTQLDNLRAWAKSNGHIIVGEYVDAGISGKKPPSRRPALARFFTDLENGLKADIFAFTKLDRFFRSVKLYYQAIDTLDKHKVAWQAIHEDYETLTAGGRMKVNIMLSVAENEADRTAERIKVIFDRKVSRGEVITGNPPLGYKIENKHLVPDENAEAVRAFFAHYKAHGSLGAARRHLMDAYGITIVEHTARDLLRNKIYKGVYRDNPNFCEPLISPDEFDEINRLAETRSVRRNPSGRIYLFSGLLVCAECGNRLSGRSDGRYNYIAYRCRNASQYHRCIHHKYTPEKQLEDWLLSHMELELDREETIYHQTLKAAPKKKADRAAIQKKLDRLKDLYVDDLITKEQYKADFAKLNAQLLKLAKIEPPRRDFSAIRKMIGSEFGTRYGELSREEKRTLWRSVLERVIIDADGNATIFFR